MWFQWCRSMVFYQSITLPIELTSVLVLADARTEAAILGGVATPIIQYTTSNITITDRAVYTPNGVDASATKGMCVIIGI